MTFKITQKKRIILIQLLLRWPTFLSKVVHLLNYEWIWSLLNLCFYFFVKKNLLFQYHKINLFIKLNFLSRLNVQNYEEMIQLKKIIHKLQ